MQAQTIEQVIGANLRSLRETEVLNLAQCAHALSLLTGESFSEAKLSRWETGKYRFTVSDLHLISQVYGVNLLALLKPIDDEITDIDLGRQTVPVDDYVYDFFVDPRGRFVDRADRLAERRGEGDGTRDVLDAINDISDRLGKRGRIGDFYSEIETYERIVEKLLTAYELNLNDPTAKHQKQWEDLIRAADVTTTRNWSPDRIERLIDRLNREEPQ